MFSYGAPLVTTIALKSIANDLGSPRSVPALAASLVWLGSGIGAIGFGWVAEKVGFRWIVAFGAMTIGAGLAVSAVYRRDDTGSPAVSVPFADDVTELRDKLKGRLAKVVQSGAKQFGLVEEQSGAFRIREKLPLVRHLDKHELRAREALSSYAGTLQEDRRVLLQRYALQDVAFKVVGVGSVGTFCAIALLVSGGGAPLLLQIKEAQQSVLAPSAGASEYPNHGQRVVVGQRILQAASDVFLGWTQKPIQERHFYVRRLKDSRLADIGTRLEVALPFYAELCGRTLARAHARAGDSAVVAGYMGSSTAFDEAIGEFAMTYADQNDRDWNAFLSAIKAGRIVAEEP